MLHIGLFEGIGGFSLSAAEVGWETVVTCEVAEFPSIILNEHLPKAYHHNNIKTLNYETINAELSNRFGSSWRENEQIVVTGGFPCQPFSTAGKRLGTEDERNLWPEMLRTIQEIKPDWIVAENVRGITNWSDGLVFEQIHIDLENEGYQVQSFILPACGVDAPHRRDRVWIIAYSNSNGHQWRGFGEDRFTETEIESQEDKWERIWSKSWGVSQQRISTNSEYDRLEHSTDENNEGKIFDKQKRKEFGSDTKHSKLSTPVSLRWPTTDTSGSELQGSKLDRSFESKRQIETEGGQFSRSIRSVWKNFPTQSPICSGNDGFPNELLRQRIREDSMGIISEQEIDKILSAAYSRWRKETLKAAGNAIVHQVATQIFKSIKLYYEQQ